MTFSDERLASLAAGQLEDVPLPEVVRELARQLLQTRAWYAARGRALGYGVGPNHDSNHGDE